MKFESELRFGKRYAERINRIMSGEEDIGEDDTIYHGVKFENGFEMDIMIYGSDEGTPWTEAVLFDEKGRQVALTEPSDEFFGEWEFEFCENQYIVYVVHD